MATPTPSGSVSKRPGGGVSTPSHPSRSSPAPRSVPSPVVTRQPASKTPVNHPTGSSTGSKTIGGTPMMHNPSQTGSNPSPTAHQLLASLTPNAFGLDSATPITMNLSTPALAASVAMIPTMSDLGLSASMVRRNEDEERRARMRRVLRKIGEPKGRVSEEGIARIARRVGFAHDIDVSEKMSVEERERKVGNRPITVAGNTVMIEIDLRDNIPRSLSITHNLQRDDMQREAARAGDLLLRDLHVVDGIPLRTSLERFAANLECLARVDRLSSTRINCFEALSGIYSCLRRLYETEIQAAETVLGESVKNGKEQARVTVMCKKSGHPTAHARARMGLDLAYWKSARYAKSASNTSGSEKANGVDEVHDEDSLDQDDDQIFSLRIETEASPATMYPSLRVSDAWLPPSIELPSADSTDGLPWQEPPPTFLNLDGTADAMTIDGESKLPDLRFVAKLDPPVVVPYPIAAAILASIGLPAPTMLTLPPQYAATLLEPASTRAQTAQTIVYNKTSSQSVLTMHDGQEMDVAHMYKLDTAKPDWSYTLEELPFSHPRQLVDLLPVLRQWACLGSLLRNAFSASSPSNPPDTSTTSNSASSAPSSSPDLSHLSLGDLMTQSKPPQIDSQSLPIPVTINLTTSPIPTLGFTFPSRSPSATLSSVSVQIMTNAEIAITGHDGIGSGSNLASSGTGSDGSGGVDLVVAKKLARGLDVCADLGVWVEWMRNGMSV